ncbi:MAG: alpha/beta hydrolase [Planctomycetes bacterium]|nr:alpha/beta hydrolase [Planctomycetota bacterium]
MSRLAFGIVLLFASATTAAEKPLKPFPLWNGEAPGALGKAEKDIPTLTPYWPDPSKATGAAIIVAPGGGYNVLAAHEGEAYAKWLSDIGIAAFVLKYRLVKDGYLVPVILQDAARSVRYVRANAKEWGIDPARIGMIGSSAGGHLSATLSTKYDSGNKEAKDPIDAVSSRPDVTILCYAFILFDRDDKKGRQERFLGPNPKPEMITAFSPALNVTKETPPCFIWQTVEDPGVVVENALVLAEAYRKAGAPFDLHLYQKGRHGIGLGFKEYDREKIHAWTRDCEFWLKEQGFLKK